MALVVVSVHDRPSASFVEERGRPAGRRVFVSQKDHSGILHCHACGSARCVHVEAVERWAVGVASRILAEAVVEEDG